MSNENQNQGGINSDSEKILPPIQIGDMVLGYVDEVHGEGAREVPEFNPTRYELIQLVKYWYKVDLDFRWFFFCFGGTGGTEVRLSFFARRRIRRIADLIGEAPVKSAVDEVFAEFKKDHEGVIAFYLEHHNYDVWQGFLNGDVNFMEKLGYNAPPEGMEEDQNEELETEWFELRTDDDDTG